MRKEPTPNEIRRVADHLVIRKTVRESSGEHAIADCPCCNKAKHLYFNLETGMWDCKRCGESGNLFKMADHIGLRVRERHVVRSSTSIMMAGLRKSSGRKLKRRGGVVGTDKAIAASERLFDKDDEHGQAVKAYLNGRGIEDEAIKHFRLGVTYIGGKKGPVAAGIPFIDGDRTMMVKMRNIDPDCDKSKRFARTKGGKSSLFNVAGARGRKRVVMVEGEIDAISLWQNGITEAVSTSIGAQGKVPQVWIDDLVDAEDIVLWYDDDAAGDDAIDGLATAFGSHRVRVASIPDEVIADVKARTGKAPKDANDLVVAGVDREVITKIIDDAKSLTTANIVKPSALADEVRGAIEMGEESLGVSTRMLGLDKLLRGWRLGELTIITGHTRHGKSTFASFILELLARVGIPVLMSSMEDGPPALFRKLFQRRFGLPLSTIKTDKDRQKAYEALDDMDRHPIYIMTHFGRTEFDRVYDDIRYAVNRLNTRYVMIDHLGFFSRPAGTDEREHLDNILMGLREMAEELQIHIFLIAHPRGSVDETTVPDAGSIKGTSGAKQICHNGITIHRSVNPLGDAVKGKTKLRAVDGRRLEVELDEGGVLALVWKVRHDEAIEGHAIFSFDARCLAYRDTVKFEREHKGTDWGDDADPAFDDDDPFMDVDEELEF
jgi:twinkle protein